MTFFTGSGLSSTSRDDFAHFAKQWLTFESPKSRKHWHHLLLPLKKKIVIHLSDRCVRINSSTLYHLNAVTLTLAGGGNVSQSEHTHPQEPQGRSHAGREELGCHTTSCVRRAWGGSSGSVRLGVKKCSIFLWDQSVCVCMRWCVTHTDSERVHVRTHNRVGGGQNNTGTDREEREK